MSASTMATVGTDPANYAPDGFYPTPAPVARAMVHLEPWGRRVWEPACGDGAISGQFIRAGHDVIETDIAPRGCGRRADFLSARHLAAPDICTNPPFPLADDFAEKALGLGAQRVMLLLELGWMQAVSRRRIDLVHHRGLARVWISSRRIPFLRDGWDGGKGGGSPRKHGLFVWEAGHRGPAALRHFDWQEWA